MVMLPLHRTFAVDSIVLVGVVCCIMPACNNNNSLPDLLLLI